MTIDEIIAIVRKRALTRYRFKEPEPEWDEALCNEIERLRDALAYKQAHIDLVLKEILESYDFEDMKLVARYALNPNWPDSIYPASQPKEPAGDCP